MESLSHKLQCVFACARNRFKDSDNNISCFLSFLQVAGMTCIYGHPWSADKVTHVKEKNDPVKFVSSKGILTSHRNYSSGSSAPLQTEYYPCSEAECPCKLMCSAADGKKLMFLSPSSLLVTFYLFLPFRLLSAVAVFCRVLESLLSHRKRTAHYWVRGCRVCVVAPSWRPSRHLPSPRQRVVWSDRRGYKRGCRRLHKV
jgi:hypothetical protein